MTKKSDAPAIRFKGFSDAWEQRKLGDIADIVGGGTPSTGNQSYWDGDIDWYAPAEIADQIYANSSQKKITGLGYENSSAKMLPPGTVLFTSRAGIGKTAILTRKGCTNQGFQSIVPHRGELDSYFIFSRTEELKRYGELVGAGSTFVEVSGKQMAVMELMMPPTMREQQTIGGFFQQLDHLITLHQRKCALLFSPFQAFISMMFTTSTFSWEQRKLGEVIRLNGRIGFRGYTEKDIVTKDDGGVLTFSPTNIVDNKLTTNCKNTYITRFKYDESPEIKIHNGDILFVKTGSTLGKSALVTGLSEDATLNPQVVVMRTNNLNVEFLAAMLVTNAIISQVNSAKIGGAIPTLTETRIKDFDVAIPVSEAEKEQIGQFFSQLDHLITLHQRQTIVYAVIRSIRKVILAERQYFAPPMVRKSP